MTILNLKESMKTYKFKNATMNESQFQRVYNYPIYPRNSKVCSDKGFVNIDNGFQGGLIGLVL